MNRNSVRTLLFKATGVLSVTGLSVLISLPGFSQQSPANTSPDVPSTVKPTNPGGRDAGTTNGGENLNRVPSSDSNTQRNNPTGQPAGTGADNADPTSNPDPINRVEGRDQGTQRGTPSSPNGSNDPSGANQPGATTGGDSIQQVEQNQPNGSTTRQNRTAPQGGSQTSPQPRTQSDTNSGAGTTGDTSQQQPSDNGVRALW
ncbi:MAG: hypothetical protein KME27_00280 [Lyngbya sp. HA4199-MV5]|nr:hypothetical protein [Lyngbya sp. HA4199-MV5]